MVSLRTRSKGRGTPAAPTGVGTAPPSSPPKSRAQPNTASRGSPGAQSALASAASAQPGAGVRTAQTRKPAAFEGGSSSATASGGSPRAPQHGISQWRDYGSAGSEASDAVGGSPAVSVADGGGVKGGSAHSSSGGPAPPLPQASSSGGGGGGGESPSSLRQASRWRDWWVRNALAWIMIFGIGAYVALLKQPGVVLLVFVFQTLIYRELVRIATIDSRERDLPGFSLFYTYWFGVCAYYMYTKTLQVHLVAALAGTSPSRISVAASPIVGADDPSFLGECAESGVSEAVARWPLRGRFPDGLGITHSSSVIGSGLVGGMDVATLALRGAGFLVTHYVPIAFALYTCGFIAFVFSLQRRRNFRYQFANFAYCHIALAVVVVQSTLLVANAYQGLYWFFLPCGLVVVNDSFAYIFGFFFGRTPLIRLSPKKTWEGFAGGAVATFVFAVGLTGLVQALPPGFSKYLMVCPVEQGLGLTVHPCDADAVGDGLFEMRQLGAVLPAMVARWLPGWLHSLGVSRMQLHSLVLAAFASAVAPFGGFFASGFKRAFRIKDFSHAIPGHGGFTDRMDCQIIMGALSYVYAHYILKLGFGFHGGTSDVSAMFSRIVSAAQPEDLVRLYDMLGCFIHRMGYTNEEGEGADTAAAGAAIAARHLVDSAAKACKAAVAAAVTASAVPVATALSSVAAAVVSAAPDISASAAEMRAAVATAVATVAAAARSALGAVEL